MFLPDGFIDMYENTDVRKIYFMGTAFVFLMPFVGWIYQYFYDFAGERYQKYLLPVFAALLIGAEIWGAAPYLTQIHQNNEAAKETNQRYAKELTDTLSELYTGKKLYVLAENIPNEKIMPLVPVFYHLDKVVLSTDKEDIKAKRYYVLTDEFEKYKDTGKEIASYQWEGKEYRLIETGS